jgi:hypothetical protein
MNLAKVMRKAVAGTDPSVAVAKSILFYLAPFQLSVDRF